jgi:hypothetical protein
MAVAPERSPNSFVIDLRISASSCDEQCDDIRRTVIYEK